MYSVQSGFVMSRFVASPSRLAKKPLTFLLLMAVGTTGLCAGGTSRAEISGQTPPVQGQAQSFQAQVATLIAANPNGGPILETRLAGLVSSQANGAAAVASLLMAMGSAPSAGLVCAVANAMATAVPYTEDELVAALSVAVSNASDSAMAARGIVAACGCLPEDAQGTLGGGLAAAANTLLVAGKASDASSISAIVSASSSIVMRTSFTAVSTDQGTTNQITYKPVAKPVASRAIIAIRPENTISPS